MTRRHVRPVVAIAATLWLTACGTGDTGGPDEDDETKGTTREEPGTAAEREDDGSTAEADVTPNKAKPPVSLPYQTFFQITHDQDSRRFVLTKASSITVQVRASWDNAGHCHPLASTFRITMFGDDVPYPGETRTFPADGREHLTSWPGLRPGKYHVEVTVENPDRKRCTLGGTMTIKIT